jgi:hypothetical protein
MPVMGTRRGDRVHVSKWIDLMSNIQAKGFVAPALDPRNTGTNAAGGESDDVSNVAVMEACAAGAAESKGDGVGGAPHLKPRARVLWMARVGPKATERYKRAQGWTID